MITASIVATIEWKFVGVELRKHCELFFHAYVGIKSVLVYCLLHVCIYICFVDYSDTYKLQGFIMTDLVCNIKVSWFALIVYLCLVVLMSGVIVAGNCTALFPCIWCVEIVVYSSNAALLCSKFNVGYKHLSVQQTTFGYDFRELIYYLVSFCNQ